MGTAERCEVTSERGGDGEAHEGARVVSVQRPASGQRANMTTSASAGWPSVAAAGEDPWVVAQRSGGGGRRMEKTGSAMSRGWLRERRGVLRRNRRGESKKKGERVGESNPGQSVSCSVGSVRGR